MIFFHFTVDEEEEGEEEEEDEDIHHAALPVDGEQAGAAFELYGPLHLSIINFISCKFYLV